MIPWPFNHEAELRLTEVEKLAFGVVDNDEGCPYLMNRSGILPCPLHAWGSQLRSCPCKCGSGRGPLSSEKLANRWLYGVVVRAAFDGAGLSEVRHIHSCECAALVGFDPSADYGEHPWLTLSAISQIASSFQAVGLGAHVISHSEWMQRGIRQFEPLDHAHACRTWFLSKCQLMWPCPEMCPALHALMTSDMGK